MQPLMSSWSVTLMCMNSARSYSLGRIHLMWVTVYLPPPSPSHHVLHCMINVTSHTLCRNINCSALCPWNSLRVTSIDLFMSVTRGDDISLTGEWDVTNGIALATGCHGSWWTLIALCTLEDHGNRTASFHWSRQPCLFRRKSIS